MLIVTTTTRASPMPLAGAPAGDHPLRGPGLARACSPGPSPAARAGQLGADEGRPGERRPARRRLQRPRGVTIPRNLPVRIRFGRPGGQPAFPHRHPVRPDQPARERAVPGRQGQPPAPPRPGPARGNATRRPGQRRRAGRGLRAGRGGAQPVHQRDLLPRRAVSRVRGLRRLHRVPRLLLRPQPGQAARAGHRRRAGSSGTRPTAPAASRTGLPNSAAASRRRGRSAGTAPSACPAASRWRRRRARAPTRCRPGTPPWPAPSVPSSWSASRPRRWRWQSGYGRPGRRRAPGGCPPPPAPASGGKGRRRAPGALLRPPGR